LNKGKEFVSWPGNGGHRGSLSVLRITAEISTVGR
jgi:hypothetical protein